MTNIEAMKLALDALVRSNHGFREDQDKWPCTIEDNDEAIAALRQQISEAEQAEFKMVCPRCKVDRVTTLCPNRGKPGDCPMTATAQSVAEQAEQEPVAIHQWRKKIPADQPWHDDEYKFAYARVDDFYEARTVYAAPVPVTTPDVCGEVCVRAKLCYGCNKDLEEANAKLAEQATLSDGLCGGCAKWSSMGTVSH